MLSFDAYNDLDYFLFKTPHHVLANFMWRCRGILEYPTRTVSQLRARVRTVFSEQIAAALLYASARQVLSTIAETREQVYLGDRGQDGEQIIVFEFDQHTLRSCYTRQGMLILRRVKMCALYKCGIEMYRMTGVPRYAVSALGNHGRSAYTKNLAIRDYYCRGRLPRLYMNVPIVYHLTLQWPYHSWRIRTDSPPRQFPTAQVIVSWWVVLLFARSGPGGELNAILWGVVPRDHGPNWKISWALFLVQEIAPMW